jgi:hypothetical protein
LNVVYKTMTFKKTNGRTFDRANPCPPTNTAVLAHRISLFVPTGGSRTACCSSGAIRPHYELEDEAEAEIVVAVRRLVVVAVSGAAILRIVVPAAAAIHAVLALMQTDLLCAKVHLF